ncbi:MAG: response regulator, partial [Gammaproteobacteria bacterium]|nr:response regulator [Gammaproteobacteria bacterium]
MQSENTVLDLSNASHQALLDEIATLRLQLGEAQQQSNLWYQQVHAISSSLKIGFWEWNQISDKVIFYSDEMAALFGLTTDELYSRCQNIEGFYDFVHPDDLHIYRENTASIEKHLRDYRDAHVFEYRLCLENGKIRHVREMEFGVFDDQGKIMRRFGVVQDISDHSQAVIELTKSEQRFFSLFDQLPVGVLEEDYRPIKKVVDKLAYRGIENIREYLEEHPRVLKRMVSDTRITNVNQALIDLHEARSKEEFIRIELDIDDWWDAEWVEFYVGEIEALAGGSRLYEAERVDSKVDGSHFETRSITTIVKGHEDDWARVITIHEDITDRKKNELDLIGAKELAEKASQAKSEFLSSMSHELRTPLNAILGFSQLFSYDESLDKQQRSNAGEINRAGKHLLVLTDEILDLSRIEAGEIEVPLESVSLLDVIHDAMAWVENLAKKRNVIIHIDDEVLTSINVNANSVRLKQVFLNLLTNAVKYNREGGSVFLELEYKDNSTVCIGIRDTGHGIGDDKLDELFQPFNRLGAEASGTEGTGIGLVITRQLVRLMQGNLEVNSVPGLGTTFWVELAIAESDHLRQISELSEHPTVTETRPVLQSEQPYILVAEDNAINRELMAAQMEMLGYKVEYAGNGAEALEKWLSGKYYVLLTDIRMPVMNGYDLIQEVRSLDITGTHPISIIAITANAMESDIEKCFEVGASDVISKPVELEELQRALKRWVPREVAIEEKNRKQQESFQNGPVIDLNVLIQSVGNNRELHHRLLKSFMTSIAEQTDDIEDAFSWRNHGKLADATHKLKSSARSMGAMELGDLCQTLEKAGRARKWPDIESTMPIMRAHCQQVENAIQNICQLQVKVDNQSPVPLMGEDIAPSEVDISVLLVDDDFIMHRVTTSILGDVGIKRVQNALSGPEALDILK